MTPPASPKPGNTLSSTSGGWNLTRRDCLKASGLALAGLSLGGQFAHAQAAGPKTRLRFGMVTDAHYADAATGMGRYYRESPAKMTECVTRMTAEKVDFLIELGDLKDQASPAREEDTLRYLATIEAAFAGFTGPRYHVLGNHDMDSISKAQFLAGAENTGAAKGSAFYSFDAKGLHCVVLDANFKADGVAYDHGNFTWTDTIIPPPQLDWLTRDLAAATTPVIVFVHQRLDGAGDAFIKNAADIRRILQESHRVLAVFQGHDHAGGYNLIEGIHYYTLKALVDGSGEANNAYAIVEVDTNNTVVVNGFRKAESRSMGK